MRTEVRERACNALCHAKAVGGVYFARIFVVGNEITFSRKAAGRMQESWIRYHFKGETMPEIEVIEFEEAYLEVHGKHMPLVVERLVYKEMDDITVSSTGSETTKSKSVKPDKKLKKA